MVPTRTKIKCGRASASLEIGVPQSGQNLRCIRLPLSETLGFAHRRRPGELGRYAARWPDRGTHGILKRNASARTMRNTARAVATFLVAGISGCVMFPSATLPTPEDKARPVQRERLHAFQARSEGTSATLVVTRDLGIFGGACYYALAINGRLAARLDTGERSRFYLLPGEVLLSVGGDPQARGLCSIGQGDWSEQKVLLHPDETVYLRLAIETNGQVVLKRSGQ